MNGGSCTSITETASTGTTPEPSDLAAPAETVPSSPAIPELLAPAGDWDCAKAAVENGADAIYFGLEKFNARMRAHNFTEADLPKLMEFLHRRGVKGYVTFNTLVFENELLEAEEYARSIIVAGVDAAIVQDVGICRLIRTLSPDFPIHVSTQMTVTSSGGMEFARELGCNLVVLARECSLKEIAQIVAMEKRLPLEVFVHGALCVAYSGQCLTSEALGGRSANRGECAQACRMPYELLSDGQLVPLGDRKYLLSPQDLAGVELLPELARLGVASLKIEGRLKTPEYVANITRIYRSTLDALGRADSPSQPPSEQNPAAQPDPARHYEMEMAFSRGLYTGWFGGINNQKLVHAHFGKKRGVYLGQVSEVRRDGVVVQLVGPLKPGDGVVFDANRPEEKEEGGRVYEIKPVNVPKSPAGLGTLALLTFGRGDIDFSRVHVGDKLWKTSDPELERRIRKTFEGDKPRFQQPIFLEVHGSAGLPMTVIVRDDGGHVVKASSGMPLAKAETQPLTNERLRDQLGRLGGTPFKLDELQNRLKGSVLLPISELNRLRREAVAELEKLRARPLRWTLREAGDSVVKLEALGNSEAHPHPDPLPEGEGEPGPAAPRSEAKSFSGSPESSEAFESQIGCQTGPPLPQGESRVEGGAPHGLPSSDSNQRSACPQLIVLCRSLPQLEAALSCGIRILYCEFEDLKKYREAVKLVREFKPDTLDAASAPPQIFVAPPRIFKMGEDWTLKQVRSCEADGYLVRNYDHLRFFENDRRVGDYSLNIANHLSAEYFKNRFCLERITASYDLNFAQLEALLSGAPAEWFEITIHQHMPMFHMEHCVFCAFLSSGTDYTNCGRPCDKHELKLRDRVGAQHPVKADAGCRNTVFNALAQTGAEYAQRMIELGARHFRIEFLTETPEQVVSTIAKYQKLLRGEISGAQLWHDLRLLSQLGVTRGSVKRET